MVLSELKNREFYRQTIHLLIPVMLQQLITTGINFLDNIMVGSFGETQIAAAALANQFYTIFQFVCMGLGSGAIVMSAQFWGSGEHKALRTTAAIALRFTVAIRRSRCHGASSAWQERRFPAAERDLAGGDPPLLHQRPRRR